MEKIKGIFKNIKKKHTPNATNKPEDNTSNIRVDTAEVSDNIRHNEVTTDSPTSAISSVVSVSVSSGNVASNSCTDIVYLQHYSVEDDSVEDYSVLDHLYSDTLTRDEKKYIASSVSAEALQRYPSYYDFCIIASDQDYQLAEEFKQQLCRIFNLKGCMLYDGFDRVGSDQFDCFEAMMAQSTKILFFLTNNFTANNFYCRLQNGAVFQSIMSKARQHKEKCVPVYPNGLCYTPLALSGISGLQPLRPDVLRQSIESTYTEPVRAHCRLLNQHNCDLRRIMYDTLLPDRAQQYILRKKSELVALTYNSQFQPSIHNSISEHTPIQSIAMSESSIEGSTSQSNVQDKYSKNNSPPKNSTEQLRDIPNSVDPTDSASSPSNSSVNDESKVEQILGSLPEMDGTRDVLKNILSNISTSRTVSSNVNIDHSENVHLGETIIINIYNKETSSNIVSGSGDEDDEVEDDEVEDDDDN